MFEVIKNAGYILAQTASEKKLTVLYLLLFMLFLFLLVLDARGKKKFAGPVAYKIVLFLVFCVGIVLLVIYFKG